MTLVAPGVSNSLRMRLVLCRLLGVLSPPLESSQEGGGVGELMIPGNSVETVETDNRRLSSVLLPSGVPGFLLPIHSLTLPRNQMGLNFKEGYLLNTSMK